MCAFNMLSWDKSLCFLLFGLVCFGRVRKGTTQDYEENEVHNLQREEKAKEVRFGKMKATRKIEKAGIVENGVSIMRAMGLLFLFFCCFVGGPSMVVASVSRDVKEAYRNEGVDRDEEKERKKERDINTF